MISFRFALLLPFFALLFFGCGQVEIPEEGETIIIPDDSLDLLDKTDTENEEGEETDLGDGDDVGDETLLATECEEEREKLSEALQVNTDALAQCEVERKRFAAKIQDISKGSDDAERYQKFVSFYLENAAIAEFPFPKCGAVNSFTTEGWFTSFKSALEAAQIPFGNKIVETSDLSGGCTSSEGNMAFFLGAENETLSEFHLLKYDIGANTIEEAFSVDGPCDVCPNRLGKRQGNFLTIFGEEGGARVEYEYYYDPNILKRR